MTEPQRLGIVVFNLGGPDCPAAVEPFLRNLFSDKAIIRLPAGFRHALARLIAARRAPIAREIYAKIGGRSPILEQTEAQARALAEALQDEAHEVRVVIAMRYWHPRAAAAAQEIAAFQPDQLVLLPLYPQFSTTTTASSFAEFGMALKRAGYWGPVRRICCYPADVGFAAANAALIRSALDEVQKSGRPRLLFSAHGLPERIVQAGDPYPWQVAQSANAILRALGAPEPEWIICYQSRVGPLKWIGPSTEEALAAAAKDGRVPVVVPIAFVSEHSETLVELDIEYRELALRLGAGAYVRVPAVGVAPAFIGGLANLVKGALCTAGKPEEMCNPRLCPISERGCPNRRAPAH